MTTLPSIAAIQVATVPLQAYINRSNAILAAAGGSSPLPEIQFTSATVILGDGNVGGAGAQVPAISTLQTTGAVTHEVWRGAIVQAVTVDTANPNQVDILCVVPAVDAGGNEIGPFYVTEFIITDEAGTAMLAGTTLMPKLVTANGAAVDLAFVASVGLSLGTVVLTPPSAAFVSMAQVQAAFNANLPTCVAPLAKADTVSPAGWTDRVFSVAKASQPATPLTDAGELAALGVTRAATAAEFTAGAPDAASSFLWPFPTLQQIKAALAALAATIPSAIANTLSIGTVTTGAAGSSAAATVTGTAPHQVLNLTIPAGATGAAGAPGSPGAPGAPGANYSFGIGGVGSVLACLTNPSGTYGGSWINVITYAGSTSNGSMLAVTSGGYAPSLTGDYGLPLWQRVA